MRILQVNKFHWMKGGAERYYFDLQAELEARGHKVAVFSTRHPLNQPTPWESHFIPEVDYGERGTARPAAWRLAREVIWNRDAASRLARLVEEFRPQVAHLHNFHHQLSPSILAVLSRMEIPTVQTLHDYKWVCPAYLFLSQGEVCERCGPGNRFHPVVVRRCLNDSLLRSAVVYFELSRSWRRRDFQRVARFLAPSRFLAGRVTAHGLPAGRVTVMPYFIRTGSYRSAAEPGRDLLYAGRLSHEKGLTTLFDAVAHSGGRLRLGVAGSGPLEATLRARAEKERLAVTFLGHLGAAELHDAIRGSRAVVVPSRWYENQPYAILEAMALGVPVVGSAIGGIPELIDEGETGHLVPPGEAEPLAAALEKLAADADRAGRMGRAARARIEREFAAGPALDQVESLYAALTTGAV